MAKADNGELRTINGREVRISNPDKPYFPGISKRDLVDYYLSVADGALRGIRDRPIVLKRFVDGSASEAFYQKRAPSPRPEWLRTATLHFPSGREAEELVVDDAAGLAWIANLGCLELHPHAVRTANLHNPDELRIDLDPGPGVAFADVRTVALEVRAFLAEHGYVAWPKTSGNRGIHLLVRLQPTHGFDDVRRAGARSVARDRTTRAGAGDEQVVEGRNVTACSSTTTRTRRNKTTSAAYSVRPLAHAPVSAPLTWDEVPDVDPSGLHPAQHAGTLRGRRRSPRRDRRDRLSARAAPRARRARRRRRSRRRSLAASLRQARGRSAARGALEEARSA